MISIKKTNKQQRNFILSTIDEQQWNIFFDYLIAEQDGKVIGTIGMLYFLDFCLIDNLFLFEDKENIQLKIALIKSALNMIDLSGQKTVFTRRIVEHEKLFKNLGFNHTSPRNNIQSNFDKVYGSGCSFMVLNLDGYFDNNCSHK